MVLNDLQPESTGTLEQPPNSTAVNASAIPIIARMCYSPFMKLTHARLTQLLYYDPETGVFTRKTAPTNYVRVGDVAGYKNPAGYIMIMIDGEDHRAHRLVWLYMTGEWPKDEIDHINGIRDDNRFANLREATKAQNSRNCKTPKSNTSGFKGVYLHKNYNKWAARIRVNKKRKHLGYFDTPEEAYDAYVSAAEVLHGEFARTV